MTFGQRLEGRPVSSMSFFFHITLADLQLMDKARFTALLCPRKQLIACLPLTIDQLNIRSFESMYPFMRATTLKSHWKKNKNNGNIKSARLPSSSGHSAVYVCEHGDQRDDIENAGDFLNSVLY